MLKILRECCCPINSENLLFDHGTQCNHWMCKVHTRYLNQCCTNRAVSLNLFQLYHRMINVSIFLIITTFTQLMFKICGSIQHGELLPYFSTWIHQGVCHFCVLNLYNVNWVLLEHRWNKSITCYKITYDRSLAHILT